MKKIIGIAGVCLLICCFAWSCTSQKGAQGCYFQQQKMDQEGSSPGAPQ